MLTFDVLTFDIEEQGYMVTFAYKQDENGNSPPPTMCTL